MTWRFMLTRTSTCSSRFFRKSQSCCYMRSSCFGQSWNHSWWISETVSFCFRSVSGRPSSIWAALLMLLVMQISSCGTRRSHCCPRRAPLDRAVNFWRRPSVFWHPLRGTSRPTLSSSRTVQLPANIYALKSWSCCTKLLWAISWWGAPHSRHRATWKRRVSAGEDSQITGCNKHPLVFRKCPPDPCPLNVFWGNLKQLNQHEVILVCCTNTSVVLGPGVFRFDILPWCNIITEHPFQLLCWWQTALLFGLIRRSDKTSLRNSKPMITLKGILQSCCQKPGSQEVLTWSTGTPHRSVPPLLIQFQVP